MLPYREHRECREGRGDLQERQFAMFSMSLIGPRMQADLLRAVFAVGLSYFQALQMVSVST